MSGLLKKMSNLGPRGSEDGTPVNAGDAQSSDSPSASHSVSLAAGHTLAPKSSPPASLLSSRLCKSSLLRQHMARCKAGKSKIAPHHIIKHDNNNHKHHRSDSGDLGDNHNCTAGTASSCQLFSMLEAMAAGTREMDRVPVAVDAGSDHDSDSVEVEMVTPFGESTPFHADSSMSERVTESDTETETEAETAPEGGEWSSADSPALLETPSDVGAEVPAAQQRPPLMTRPSTQHARWLQAENENVSAKFAALSMNTLSSPFGGDSHSQVTSGARRPSYRPEQLYATDSEDDVTSHSTAATSKQPSTPTTLNQLPSADDEIRRFTRDEYNEAEKLKTIVDEFGDIASNMVNLDGTPSEPEHILAESQGTLFKGVMMIGNLHLTTHRLLFHALLPPDSAFVPPAGLPDQTDDGENARPNIIRAGPVTVHRSSYYKAKRRVWMELSPEMITTYPSGDEKSRVRPLFSILMSTVSNFAPFDEDHPTDFVITYDSPDGERTSHFSVDNEHSAITWRRYFEGALFKHSRQRFRNSQRRDQGLLDPPDGESALDAEGWSMMRCCVPLDRASVAGISEYHSFATLVKLDVKVDNEHIAFESDSVAEGNFIGLDSTPPGELERHETARRSVSDDPKREKRPSRFLPSLGSRSRESSREREQKRGSGQFSSPLRVETAPAATGRSSFDGNHTPAPSPIARSQTTYLDATAPERLKSSHQSHWDDEHDEHGQSANMFDVIIGVLNEQSWFVEVLGPAVEAAHERKYKDGAVPAKFTLDVGGYDCLAKDDDIEPHRDSISSENSSLHDEDEEAGKPHAVVEARKREKAAMAARVFGLREDEGIWLKRCYIGKVAPARGHIIITPRYVCFWRRANVGADIKYRYAVRDIKGAENVSANRIRMHGLNVKIHGQADLHFEFWKKSSRDEVKERINELVHLPNSLNSGATTPTSVTEFVQNDASTASFQSAASALTLTGEGHGPLQMWQQVRGMKLDDKDFEVNPAMDNGSVDTMKHAAQVLAPPPDLLLYPKAMSDMELSYMPFVANRPWQGRTGWNMRLTPRRFAMLTIGSRGDVQPYIALALRLMEDGHTCVIVTHDEFKAWIESYGIEHRQAGGDPTALMKLSTDHAMFSPGFFKEALGGFRKWLDDLLADAWEACQDVDVLIESPSAMAGVHIAEGLAKVQGKPVPYFRAFTMPWTRTSAYPQAFMVPQIEMGPSFNYSTYVLFENIMWRATSGQINRWRKKVLGLKSTDQETMSINKVPFLYNFSPAVVPKPLDWDDDITITGYWNLENSDMEWSPPASLEAFMTQAKEDGKPIVYIGFGSIIVPDPAAVTKSIAKGVEKSGVRAIIAKGWSARDAKTVDDEPLPASCYAVDKVPHGWLFPKIQAAMHHGGAGTTGASLRAGIPTLIKPWFGDQHFWALRVTKLGVGAKVSSLRSDDIADALTKATTSRVMVEKASRIGDKIRAESGVEAAVQAIHYNIGRAARDRKRLRKDDSVFAAARLPVANKGKVVLAPAFCSTHPTSVAPAKKEIAPL